MVLGAPCGRFAKQDDVSQICGVLSLHAGVCRAEAQDELVAAGFPKDSIALAPADVSVAQDMVNAAALAAEKFGTVHALVNSAGVTSPKEFDDVSAAEFEHVYKINVLGTRNAVAGCLPYLKKNGGGRIMLVRIWRCCCCFGCWVCTCVCVVQVSSVAGQLGIFGYSAYAPTKFALMGLAQCLQMELRRHNIYVSLLFPPDTDTPMLREENKIKPKETLKISEVQ